MKTEKELRADSWRGEQAKMILNNQLVVDYFTDRRTAIMQNLEEGELNRERERELILMLKAFGHFEREFKRHIRDGKKAQTLLEKLLKR